MHFAQSMIRIALFGLITFMGLNTYAFHIIGGEIYYNCLGNNQYEIIMKIYRDPAAATGADFDDPAKIGVFRANGSQFGPIISLPLVSRTVLTGQAESPCIITPEISIQEGTYRKVIELPPSTGGYTLVYQRCCRNQTIKNLIEPESQGATYSAFIPGPEVVDCNNSPRYKNFPPIAICTDFDLEFDHSATDPDGDDLRYFFCEPEQGGSQQDPAPDPTAPPFTPVRYRAAYNAESPFEASPPALINEITGLLTATPRTLGQFVVGVCVEESRNGQVISVLRRDFQFNMAACRRLKTADYFIANGDNTQIFKPVDTMLNCDDYTFNFTDNSDNATTYVWDFGDPTTNDDIALNVLNPSYTYPDTGLYEVMLVIDPEDTVCSDTQSYFVQIYPGFEADFSFDTTCANVATQFNDESVAAFGEIVKWQWSFGLGNSAEPNPFFAFQFNGNFPVTLRTESNFGCFDEVTKVVTPYPTPSGDFTIDNSCLNNNAGFQLLSQLDTSEIKELIWVVNSSDTLTGFNPTYIWTEEGIQSVELFVVSKNDCSGRSQQLINVIAEDPFTIELNDATICEGDFVTFDVDGAIEYEWFPKEGVFKPFSPSVSIAPDSTTEYTLVAKGVCNVDSFYSLINVIPAPEVFIQVDSFRNDIGDTILIEGQTNATTFYWTPEFGLSNPNSLSTELVVNGQRQYTLIGVNEAGCVDSAVLYSYVFPSCFDLIAPNAFTPNGDGLNDVFVPFNRGGSEISIFTIFNRWGEKVFESSSLEIPWDGRVNNGELAPLGVYVWQIMVVCGEEERLIKGNVTLIR